MTYARDASGAAELYIEFTRRGDQANETVLDDILKLRAEKAPLLGYSVLGRLHHRGQDDRQSGERAAEFIARVAKLAEGAPKRDYERLLRRKQKDEPTRDAGRRLGEGLLEDRVKKERYEVRRAGGAPVLRVRAGARRAARRSPRGSSASRTCRCPDAPVVARQVVVYDVFARRASALGRIYLDMHPRDGKYKHAAQFPLKDGVAGVQLPEGVLVCNFPDPAASPALMEHDDVVTLFHEFGHLHAPRARRPQPLGRASRASRPSGTSSRRRRRCSRSGRGTPRRWRVRAPHETGAADPGRAGRSGCGAADEFGKGLHARQQIFYAALSLALHRRAAATTLDITTRWSELQERYTPFRYVPGTHFHASFGHLVGYSAMYYTYMWSLVIAKDLLTPFERGRGCSTTRPRSVPRHGARAGRAPGRGRAGQDFLGRPYDFEAFQEWLEKA